MSIKNNKTKTVAKAVLDKTERPERNSLKENRNLMYEKFRTNLRVLCGSVNTSMVQLSEDMGLKSGARITDLQYGRGTPEMDEMILISEYFGFSIDDLITKQAVITFK